MTLEEKIEDWNKVTDATQAVHRAMMTGKDLTIDVFKKYMGLRRGYETKYEEKYTPFVRPK
jgi:hypothetical protein